ncbi:MAG: hypothetical protein LUG64_01490 [Clostridiales bacterium]|nr:hypothetical protein [Clostridiales bacterium]
MDNEQDELTEEESDRIRAYWGLPRTEEEWQQREEERKEWERQLRREERMRMIAAVLVASALTILTFYVFLNRLPQSLHDVATLFLMGMVFGSLTSQLI